MSGTYRFAALGLLAAAGCTAVRTSVAETSAAGHVLAPTLNAPEDAAHLHHEHAPLDLDRGLGWDALLEHTLLNYPRYLELEAREQEAQAWKRRAGTLLGAQPSVSFSYRSDKPLDDYGFVEYESGVLLPLWRGGQRSAAADVGTSVSDEARAAEAGLRWQIAGKLRESLWNIESALNGVELAQEALDVAEELERVVVRRNAAGDLPLEDTLLAHSTVLDREAALIERQAELVDAERSYQKLTGLTTRPATFAEKLTSRSDFDETHPLLVMADAEVERARAEMLFAAKEAKGKTIVAIGPRRQRDALTDFFVDSVGVAVSVPFGGEAQSAPSVAAAGRLLAQTEAERAATRLELDATLHEAVHTLEVTENALRLADEQADIAARRWQMGRTAFEEGEISLLDLLRREEASRLAVREAARLRIQRGRTIAEVNQAIGEFP